MKNSNLKRTYQAIFVFICLLASLGHAGSEAVGGGDSCENRIKVVRDDLGLWLKTTAPEGLTLPNGITSQFYAAEMLSHIAKTKIRCVSKQDQDFPVKVNGTPKICRFDKSKNEQWITCDIDKLMGLSESPLYVVVHHEYAGLADIEIPIADDSNYSVSNQISVYLEDQVVKRLAIKPALRFPDNIYGYYVSGYYAGNDMPKAKWDGFKETWRQFSLEDKAKWLAKAMVGEKDSKRMLILSNELRRINEDIENEKNIAYDLKWRCWRGLCRNKNYELLVEKTTLENYSVLVKKMIPVRLISITPEKIHFYPEDYPPILVVVTSAGEEIRVTNPMDLFESVKESKENNKSTEVKGQNAIPHSDGSMAVIKYRSVISYEDLNPKPSKAGYLVVADNIARQTLEMYSSGALQALFNGRLFHFRTVAEGYWGRPPTDIEFVYDQLRAGDRSAQFNWAFSKYHCESDDTKYFWSSPAESCFLGVRPTLKKMNSIIGGDSRTRIHPETDEVIEYVQWYLQAQGAFELTVD